LSNANCELKLMSFPSSHFSRWLTIFVGGVAAMLAAFWVARRLNTSQPAVAVADTQFTPLPTVKPEGYHPARPIRRWQVRLAWLIGTVSCFIIIIAAFVFQSGMPNDAPTILLVGAVGLGVSLLLNSPAFPKWQSAERVNESFGWLQAGLGILCLSVLVIFNLTGPTTISGHVQFLILCIGIVMVISGFGGALLPLERYTLHIVGAITLVALVLRLVALDSAIHFFIDEANFADATILAWRTNPPLLARFSGMIAFPWLYPYMESMAIDLLGRHLFSLRFVSAIFGTLTIPSLYMLARALFNKPTALVAAILLATFPPHLHFSRMALNNIADPLFGTLALGWFAWGWRTGRQGYFALAGAALGLTQYFYDGGRLLFPPLIVAWMVCCAVLMWLRRDDRQGRKSGVLRMLLVAFIVAAPLYIVWGSQNLPFSARFDSEGAPQGSLTVQDILLRLWDTFLLYIQNVETSFFYLGDKPLLLVFTAAPFLMGLIYAAWRGLRFDYGGVLLVGWVLITSAGNALLTTPFVSARYVVVFPALMLLTSLGLYLLLQIVVRRERWVRNLLIAIVPMIVVAHVGYYFFYHVPLYNDQSRVYEDSQDAAFRSANFPSGTHVHIIADPLNYHTYARSVMWFLRDDIWIDFISPADLTPQYMASLERGSDHAFYILPDDAITETMIRRYFSVVGPRHSPYPLPPNREFVLFYAARSQNP
jgi:4-amino-4-deoxy-L-arabinose transferase-like glycosyltransferase